MSGHDVPSSGTPPTGGDPGYDAVIEDLLAGRLGHEPEDDMSLVGLVDALRAPGSDEELGDLDAATAAFVSARAGAGAEGVVVPLASRRTGRAAVAVAAVLGGVVLLGGTAAAATGNLPPVLQDAVHVILPFVPTAEEAQEAKQAELTSSQGTTASSAAGTPATSPSRSAGAVDPIEPTDPNRVGLCTAYFARATVAMDATAMRRLQAAATQAGTTVDAWCIAFAPGSGPGKPSTAPSGPGSNNGNGNPSPPAGSGSNNSGGNGNGNNGNGNNGNPTPPTGSGNNNSGGNGNGSTKGSGATPAVTPSAKPTAVPRQPTSTGKPATPGSQGNGRPSATS